MRELGRIVRLQIQRASLKAGQRPYAYYDPTPLLEVTRLLLTPDGACAPGDDGATIRDIHHALHPHTRNRNDNSLSFGFTGHYAAMRAEFGPYLNNGIAGENILIECPYVVTEAELGAAIVCWGDDGRVVRLGEIIAAPPCVEFTQFALGGDTPPLPEQIRAALQFLDCGMRGFYARLEVPAAELRLGDQVFCEP